MWLIVKDYGQGYHFNRFCTKMIKLSKGLILWTGFTLMIFFHVNNNLSHVFCVFVDNTVCHASWISSRAHQRRPCGRLRMSYSNPWLCVQRSRCQHVVLPSLTSDPESKITLWCRRLETHCLRRTFVFFVTLLHRPTSATCVVRCFWMESSVCVGAHNLKERTQDRWFFSSWHTK